MAVVSTDGLERIPMPVDPQYRDINPEGLAWGAGQILGDASGGSTTFTINVDSQFIYRVEYFNVEDASDSTITPTFQVALADWLNSKVPGVPEPLEATSHFVQLVDLGATRLLVQSEDIVPMLRKLILYDAARGSGVTLMAVLRFSDNQNGLRRAWTMLCSYWRPEALHTPGFLASFYGQQPVRQR